MYGKGNENSKEQRPLPPSVLRSSSTGSVITSPLACAVGPPVPAVLTLGRFALGQVFGSVLLERPNLSRRSINNSQRILGGMLALTTSSANSLKHCLPLFHRPERKINI